MAGKTAKTLTAKELTAKIKARREASTVSMIVVGGCPGLLIRIDSQGNTSWILRVSIGGKRCDMGLGTYPEISLAEAREEGQRHRLAVASGINPLEKKRLAKQVNANVLTFRSAAEKVIEIKKKEFRNPKHLAQWKATLEQHVYPHIGNMDVAKIDVSHVLMILEKIWTKTNETSSRVRGRIETILNWAKAKGYRTGDNPAAWRGNLDALLPSPAKIQKPEHMAALPYEQISRYMADLNKNSSMSAWCLRFAILTACRSGEARKATWREIDFQKRLWTIPAERMKARKEHVIPLSDEVLTLLETVPRFGNHEWIFTTTKGKPLSDMALTMLTRSKELSERYGYHTCHGMRSTFRDWAGETRHFSRDTMEHALAHQLPDKVEAAYARGSQLVKRREVMQDWASYCMAGKLPDETRTSIVSVPMNGTGPSQQSRNQSTTMKLLVLSDLHNEISMFKPSPVDADVVILAGDISLGMRGIAWARQSWPSKEIVFVPGNHEYYRSEIGVEREQMESAARAYDVHVLDRRQVVIRGVRFLGATLWTDFNLFGEAERLNAMQTGLQGLTDFRLIECGDRSFTPEDYAELNRLDTVWLEEKLDEPFDGKTVVVTHHLPSKRSVAERYKNELMSACFASDLDRLMGKSVLWVHGHTHDSFDYELKGTRVVCNPRGYAPSRNNQENADFNPELLITL